jgi:hypothetical protein
MNLPYGQNEGDIWTGERSPAQEHIDREHPGSVLIHEMYRRDGEVEEIIYTTELPHLIARARQGDKIFGTVLCPRCGIDRYLPYEQRGVTFYEGPAVPPALSRVDNKTYVCSGCGQDEAMRDFAGEPPIPPDEWPLTREGRYGIGQR